MGASPNTPPAQSNYGRWLTVRMLLCSPTVSLTFDAKAATTGDELIVASIDLDQMTPVRRRWNFLGRRQPQHYGILLQPVTEKESHR